MLSNDLIEIVGIEELLPGFEEETAFKQFIIEETVSIPKQKPDVEQVVSVMLEAKVEESCILQTPIGISPCGLRLTGFKLLVKGKLLQKVEYVACDEEQSVHAAHFEKPFCTYIVLPRDFREGSTVDVKIVVESAYVKQLDCRNIFKNVLLAAYAEIKPSLA